MLPIDEKTRRFIEENRNSDPAALVLKNAGRTDIDLPLALEQIEGWQRIREKVPSWAAVDGLRYPARLSVEQCSGEHAARYKAALVARLVPSRGSMADLTGGFGVDFAHLAPLFTRAVYVEQSAELCAAARHNMALLGIKNIRFIEGNSTEVLPSLPPLDFIYIDPARRDKAGRKTITLADCTPGVARLADALLGKAGTVLVKLSPMIDLSEAMRGLPRTAEMHVVGDRGECKEVLAVLRRTATDEPRIVCADGRLAFTPSEEAGTSVSCTGIIRHYLYEPEATVLKAGAFRTVGTRYGLEKLHPNSHLYTSDRLATDFPGRVFEVERVAAGRRKDAARTLGGQTRANLTVRNFPATVDELRKRLKLHDGGGAYLFATTVFPSARRLILCRKVR